MSTRKKQRNFIQRLLKRWGQSFNALIKGLVNGVLRSLMVFKRRSRQSQAGFVLPTVVMVMLVVALLTTAIVIRSFDRAKNASNYRIDEAVINAAKPALDRSRAKIDRLFSVAENRLAGGTPPEIGTTGSIEDVLNKDEYTFGDETRLKLVTYTDAPDNSKQQLTSVWKFPVDTDNNGQLDSNIIYGIYFRNPRDNADRKPERQRTTIEARALPQATGQADVCLTGGGASAEGGGWYDTGGQLKKAFFTYVAAVPISQSDIAQIPAAEQAKYEVYKGKKGFSALEMQQDQARFALDNNAVWYDDDLEIANVPIFRLNGRIHTNSNLMIANNGTEQEDSIILYQVSSINSCYYKPENGMIVVGGNVVAGNVTGDTQGKATHATNNLIKVHLYQGDKEEVPDRNNPETIVQEDNINATNKTTQTQESPPDVASNINAYEKRLRILVNKGFAQYTGPASVTTATFPADVVTEFASKYDATATSSDAAAILKRALETYFGNRLRRVSYKEVPFGTNPFVPYTEATVPGVTLPDFDPPVAWRDIDPSYSQITLNINGSAMKLSAINPEDPTNNAKIQYHLGDRILVGNALPRQWKDPDTGKYVEPGTQQDIAGDVYWNDRNNGLTDEQRYRIGRVRPVDDLGDTSRGGFWEKAAALAGKEFEDPSTRELAGGLRVITGAGIYVDGVAVSAGGAGLRESQGGAVGDIKSFLPAPPTVAQLRQEQTNNPNGIKLPKEILEYTDTDVQTFSSVVWPDTMPMYRWKDNGDGIYQDGEVLKGDLQMRATVVYHYNQNGSGNNPTPLACISSYYDPSTPETAQNASGLPQNPDLMTTDRGTSNNGINYPVVVNRTITDEIKRQAYMIFPNGRWVNEPLKRAVQKGGTDLTLEEISALDAATCALGILSPTSIPQANDSVPDFAIQERTFLDARQVKALHKRYTDETGTVITGVTRQTLLTDITDADRLKIAELGELALAQAPDPGTNTPPPYYSLPIEQRQPLEIRVTEIDLGDQINGTTGLRMTSAGTVNGNAEYMLPNSGIIYASRDDALADITDSEFDSINQAANYGNDKGGSATDFKLDPTRRPNGIRIVNGENLARDDNYREVEKGLILASNLPVYIKGEFNLHVGTDGTTVREEFLGTNDHLNLPNWDNFYTRDNPDPNFACRPNINSPGTCPNGDRWRPARILADAVTLLSSNFRDGYRTEGDYDINNNAGNLAVEARLKNGFWWNSFATSAEWYDPATPNGPPKDFDASAAATGIQGSSYATNGVTPIQRRVNFREYKMEICRKLPVSACGPMDWTQNGAGTTAPYPDPPDPSSIRNVAISDRIYPRRVAFKRNAFGGLNPTDGRPVPIAVNGNTNVEVPYNNAGDTALDGIPLTDNALWYFTTTDTANTNPAAGISYENANNLYFPNLNNDLETASENQVLLPGTPEFGALGVTLNGLTENDPSDFAVCTTTQSAKLYQPLSALGGACDPNALTQIEAVRQALLTWNPVGDPSVNLEALPNTAGTLTAKAQINIYTLPATNATNPNWSKSVPPGNWILDRGNQSDPIFIFRSNPAHASAIDDFLNFPGVNLTLQGVDPNNIFWVASGRIAIQSPSKLAGTFIGSPVVKPAIANSGKLTFYGPNTNQIELTGRILGVNAVNEANNNIANVQITALTKTEQPLLIPVLQLHSPAGSPGNAGTAFNGRPINAYSWVQRVNTNQTANYNAVFIMGDSPSRPFPNNPSNLGESGGGLPNFPRFLEAWEEAGENEGAAAEARTRIAGSFIQFRKSSYATAPFESIDDPTQDTSLFFDGANPDYMANFQFRDYRYQGGGQIRKAAYYRPPLRLWGYDVGLLSQSPDLFSRRFANPTAGTPNEYYREVSRTDPWIQTLLCAAEPTGAGGQYQPAIADPQQRPSTCPPLAEYNDNQQQGG